MDYIYLKTANFPQNFPIYTSIFAVYSDYTPSIIQTKLNRRYHTPTSGCEKRDFLSETGCKRLYPNFFNTSRYCQPCPNGEADRYQRREAYRQIRTSTEAMRPLRAANGVAEGLGKKLGGGKVLLRSLRKRGQAGAGQSEIRPPAALTASGVSTSRLAASPISMSIVCPAKLSMIARAPMSPINRATWL